MKVRLQMFVICILILTTQSSCKKSDSQTSDNSNGNNADLISRFMPVDSTYALFTSICIDKNNNKWLTTNEGVYKFDGTTWTHYNSSNTAIAFGNTMSIQSDASGIVYAITQPNVNNKPLLAIFKSGVWSSYPFPFNALKIYINKSSTNLFVLAEGGTLYAYNGSGDYSNYSSYNKIVGVSGNSNDCYFYNGVWYFSFDYSNATDNNKYSGFASTDKNLPQPVYYTPNPNYISMSKVITSDGTSIILVGTSGNSMSALQKLYLYKNGVWSVIPYNTADQKLEVVSSIVYSKDGSLWIGSYLDGFAKYYNGNFTFYSYGNNIPVVSGLAIDDSNIKWIATYTSGLLKCTAQ